MSEPPRRDAHGRLLEKPPWLRPGWGWVRAAQRKRKCLKADCTRHALRGSDRCYSHDLAYRAQKNADLAAGRRAPTPHEAARLYRAQVSKIWKRNPWLRIVTLWLAPKLEEQFVLDARHSAAVDFDTVAPCVLNSLRWSWVRSRLNHDDPPAWQRALKHARARQRKIGPPPRGYAYEPSPEAPPVDFRIRQVLTKAPSGSPARRNPAVDHETRARLQRESTVVAVPPMIDVDEIITENWPALHAVAAGDQRVLAKIELHRAEVALALVRRREGDFEPWIVALAKLRP